MILKAVINVVLWVFPWAIRRRLMIAFWGYRLSSTARIGYSIILCRRLVMMSDSRIGNLSVCKNIDTLEIGEYSSIGSLNFITGFPTTNTMHFNHVTDRRCELVIGRHSAITSRHFIDCNGGVYVGNFTTIAGIRSQVLSHSIDLYRGRQDAAAVQIGNYCFIGTGVIFLPGSRLPDYCVLGAGSVLNKQYEKILSVYAGVPAKQVKALNLNDVAYFSRAIGWVK